MDWKFARIRKYLIALFAALSTIFVVFNISFFLWSYPEFRYFITGLLRQDWLTFFGLVVVVILLPFALIYRSHISNIAAKASSFVTRNKAVSLLGVLVALLVIAYVLWLFLMWKLPESSSQYDPTKDAIDFEIKILGGIVILFAAYAAWRRVNVMERGQITERFTRAIDQLGATDTNGKPQIEIRLGGIFALEQIAKENPDEYHSPIMEILTAYIRENAPWPPKGERKGKEQEKIKPREDVQAVLTVIGRREQTWGKGEKERLNLRSTDLRGAKLREGHLEGANLRGAHLEGASLYEARLEGAGLVGAHLEGASLLGADLTGAYLWGAKRLTVEQLSEVKTLYNAKLDPGLEEEVRGKCKHLLDGASFRKTR